MTQPYLLTGTLLTPNTRKRLPLRLRSNRLVGSSRSRALFIVVHTEAIQKLGLVKPSGC
jgi:hypothetical protein